MQAHLLQSAAAETITDVEKMLGRMQMIERSARHLAKLVDGLLDVSQMRDPEPHLNLEELDLSLLTRDVAERLRVFVERSGATLSVVAPSPIRGVRRLVQAHGGRVLVSSSLGAGSTFTVELPRTPPGTNIEPARTTS